MTQHDDGAWLDALAGRDTGDTPAAREAQGLRAAILSRDLPAIEVAQTDPAREYQLLERARCDEGVRAPIRSSRVSMWGLAAAAVVFVTFGTWLFQTTHEDEFVVRSLANGTIHVQADDPPALKQRLLRDLRAAGVKARGYQRFDVEGIDAELPDPIDARVAAVLARYRIAAPADGVLRLEIGTTD